jgi:hypothetical protein
VCDTLCTSVEHVRVHNGRTMHRLSFARNTDQKLSFSHIPTEYQTASKLLCPFRNKLQYNRCRKWLRIGHMVQQDVTEEGTIARNIGNHMYSIRQTRANVSQTVSTAVVRAMK